MADTDVLEKTEQLALADNIGSNNSSNSADNNFQKMHITKLRSIAAKAGIEGTSSMKKGDLISGIEQALINNTLDRESITVTTSTRAKKSSQATKNVNESTPKEETRTVDETTTPIDEKNDTLPGVPENEPVISSRQTSRNSRNRSKMTKPSIPSLESITHSGDSDSTVEGIHGDASGKSDAIDGDDYNNIAVLEKAIPADNIASVTAPTEVTVSIRDRGTNRKQQINKESSESDQKQTEENKEAKDSEISEEERNRRQGRRFRDRKRTRDRVGRAVTIDAPETVETEKSPVEEEQIQVVAGILDVLDNYAFLRTTGYLPGPSDVYVSMNIVRKYALRRGDHIVGAVKIPKETEAGHNGRQKFNPLIRLDSVNRKDPEEVRKRPDFAKLIPLYPNERLRLETQPNILTTRVIDLIMPIGKGQRDLIVSPPKAGKTTILQDIANAIAANNSECYLMVVLVDERPEEVTDMQRSVKGEVISSTFDRPPSDHTAVAELAIERAKRLVEDGQDVVVLLDSITRLGRAYNNSTPASGRILSGGVDSTALYPPKRFLGAARNIEGGGSLTIIATAMVETGSTGDTVIFEEFKGIGNAELKLDRKIAERRVFPAVDVNPSSTRKDELLLSSDEANIVHKLRRLLSGLDAHQAIDLLITQLKKTRNNVEFLMSVSKTTPSIGDERPNS